MCIEDRLDEIERRHTALESQPHAPTDTMSEDIVQINEMLG